MTIGTVPAVLDLSQIGASGVAAHRLHAFLSTLTSTLGAVTNPLSFKGTITVANTFPLIAAVENGWFYKVTADVTDNGGATYTNTGQVFLAGQEIAWNGTNWTIVGDALTAPFQFKGNIANAAGFPPPAATLTTGVKDGHVYRCTAGVTDNDAAKTNTGQIFLLGDIIVWQTSAWYIIQKAPSAATPAAIGTAAAGTSPRPSNDDHVHAHGNLAGGTFHAAAVAGVSDGFMTGAMATTLASALQTHGNQLGGTLHSDAVAGVSSGFMSAAGATMLAAHDVSIAAIVDDHVYAKASAVDIMTDESEKTGVLTGDGAKHFVPTHLIIQVATVTGTPATPGAINVGTAADGAQIASGIALTGLILVGDTRVVPLTAQTQHIAGNATLYVNVETAEATATVMTCDVWVRGVQV